LNPALLVLPSTINIIGASYREIAETAPTSYIEVNYENMYLSYKPYNKLASEYEEAIRAAHAAGRRVPVIHAPYESWLMHVGSNGIEELANTVTSLGVKVMVFHLPSTRYGDAWQDAIKTLSRLQDKYNVEVAVENLVAAPPWSNPHRLAETANKHGISLCIDTGHLHLNGYDTAEIIDKYLDMIRVLHVHDNHGTSDEHLIVGAGTINWLRAAASIRRAAENGSWIVLEEKCIARREGISACKARLILQAASMTGMVTGWNGYRKLLEGGIRTR